MAALPFNDFAKRLSSADDVVRRNLSWAASTKKFHKPIRLPLTARVEY
jgi:hypothetical protein